MEECVPFEVSFWISVIISVIGFIIFIAMVILAYNGNLEGLMCP